MENESIWKLSADNEKILNINSLLDGDYKLYSKCWLLMGWSPIIVWKQASALLNKGFNNDGKRILQARQNGLTYKCI